MAEEHADRESGAEDFEARESFSGGGSDDEIQEYRPIFDHFSTRDARAEEVEHDFDSQGLKTMTRCSVRKAR